MVEGATLSLDGWSNAGPILCPECSRSQDACVVIAQAWREQRVRELAGWNERLQDRLSTLHDALALAEVDVRPGAFWKGRQTMLAAEDIDFANVERQVVERIRALSAVCSDKLDATDEMRSAIFRDLILPNLSLLAQFCAGVDIAEEENRE